MRTTIVALAVIAVLVMTSLTGRVEVAAGDLDTSFGSAITITTVPFLHSPRRTACQPTAIGSVSAASLRRQAVGHPPPQRLLHEHLLGVRTRTPPPRQTRSGEPRCRGSAAAGKPRPGFPVGADRPAAGAVLDDLAAELVPEDHLLLGAHQPVVTHLGRHVGEFVRSGGGRAGPSRRCRSAARRSAAGPCRASACSRSITASVAALQLTAFIPPAPAAACRARA